ncbi:MAG: hypothetical protein RL077_5935 [Verrucomicrobiota bacterium]
MRGKWICGLITAFDRSGKANAGHALETAVLVELERRRCERACVRTREGFEVDFLATPLTGRPVLIQVCADVSAADTRAREFRSLVAAMVEHKRLSALRGAYVPNMAFFASPPLRT